MPSLSAMRGIQDETFFKPESQQAREKRLNPAHAAFVGFDYGVDEGSIKGDMAVVVSKRIVCDSKENLRQRWQDSRNRNMSKLVANLPTRNSPLDIATQRVTLEAAERAANPPRVVDLAAGVNKDYVEGWGVGKTTPEAPKWTDETGVPISGIFDNIRTQWREQWKDGRCVQRLAPVERLTGMATIKFGFFPDLPCPF